MHIHPYLFGFLLFLAGATFPVFGNAQCGTAGTTPCNAPIICSTAEMNAFCETTGGPNTLLDVSASTGCYVEVNNTQWVRFIAGSTTLSLKIEVDNCTAIGTGTGLQALIAYLPLGGDCLSPNDWEIKSNCAAGLGTEVDITLNATGLVIGQMYNVMIDGYDGALCEYGFEVLSGTIGATVTGIPVVTGPASACVGTAVQYQATGSSNNGSFAFIISPGFPGTNFTTTYSSTQGMVSFTYPDLGAPYIVQINAIADNNCSSTISANFFVEVGNDITGTNPPTLFLCSGESATYDGDVYSFGSGLPANQNVNYTFTNSNGCDSTITLNIKKIPAPTASKAVVLCSGETYDVCGTPYSSPGLTSITCPNASYLGCDSTLFLTISYNNLNAIITPPAQVTCAAPTTTLSASTSTASGSKTYKWYNAANVLLGSTATQANCAVGNYYVIVTSTLIVPPPTGGIKVCTDTAFVTVSAAPGNTLPAVPIVVGSTDFCQISALNYSVSNATTNTYTWTVVGGVLQSGQGTSTISVLWGATGGSISVIATNACGSTPSTPFSVNFTPLAVNAGDDEAFCTNPGTIPLPLNPVNGQVGSWAGFTSGNSISLSSGISGGIQTANLTMGGTGTFILVYTISQGGCIGIDTAIYTIGTLASANNAGPDQTFCANPGTVNLPINLNTGQTGDWSGSVLSGGNTVSIAESGIGVNYTAQATFTGAGVYRFIWKVTENTCVAYDTTLYTILSPIVANAGPNENICDFTAAFDLPFIVAAGQTGAWTANVLSGTGTASFAQSGSGPGAIAEVSFTNAGTFNLIFTLTQGTCTDKDTAVYTVNDVVNANAGPNENICDFATAFDLPFIVAAGQTGAWAANVVSGTGTASLNQMGSGPGATAEVSFTNSGTFNLIFTLTQGTCTDKDTAFYTVNDVVSANAGPNENICDFTTAFDLPFIVAAGQTGAWTANIISGAGTATFAQSGSGPGATAEVSFTNAGTFNLMYTLTQGTCTDIDTAVYTVGNLLAPDAGLGLIVCGNQAVLSGIAVTPPLVGVWTGQLGLSFTDINDPNSGVSATGPGIYDAYWTITSTDGSCSNSDTVSLEFVIDLALGSPTIECNPNFDAYTVIIPITAGSGPYSATDIVNFDPFGSIDAANIFTSAPINSTEGVTFEIADQNGCLVTFVQLPYDCASNCATQAGTIAPGTLSICGDNPIVLPHNGNQLLDTDDALHFLIYETGSDIQSAFIEAITPEIIFDASVLSYGVTYQVVAVAGNNVNGTIDLSDPCLSVSAPVPFVFYENPTLTAGTFATTLCEGICEALSISLTGSGPYNIGLDGSSNWTTSATDTVFQICAATDGGFCIVSVANNNCTVLLNDCFNYTVTPNATAGTATVGAPYCVGATDVLNLFDLLNGEDTGGVWTDLSTTPVPTAAFNATTGSLNLLGVAANIYNFQYAVGGLNGCAVSTSVVGVSILALPVANAGLPQTLTCTQTSLTLGSAPQTGYTYAWSLNGTAVSSIAQPVVSAVGTYDLTVSVGSCSSTDNVVVSQDATVANAVIATTSTSLTCLQPALQLDASGSTGLGTLSYKWFLEGVLQTGGGSAFVASTAGNYSLVVSSVINGCTDTSTVQIISLISTPDVVLNAMGAITCAIESVTIQTAGSDNNLNWVWSGPGLVDVSDPSAILVNLAGTYATTVTDANGCTKTSSVEVMKNTTVPSINAIGGELTCTVDQVTLTATADAGADAISYFWYTLDGLLSGDINSLTPFGELPGSYYFVAQNLVNLCSDTAVATVVINANFPESVQFNNIQAGCYGLCEGVISIDTVLGGVGPYTFQVGTLPPTSASLFPNLCADTFAIQIIDANGCVFDTSAVLVQFDSVSISLGPDTTITLGNSVALELQIDITEADIATLNWPELGASCNTACLEFTVTPFINITYTAQLTDVNGCFAETSKNISVFKTRDLYIPTAFSPNGDETNPYFFLYPSIEVAAVARMDIFDRWGNQVFSSSNLDLNSSSGWDGTNKGQLLNSGVYSYFFEVIFIDGLKKTYSGDVTLLY